LVESGNKRITKYKLKFWGRKRSAGTQRGTKPGHDNAQGVKLSSLTDMLE
jgi:hypothetical protein